MIVDLDWLNALPQEDLEIVVQISSYFKTNMSLEEKMHRARLIALMDLEYDPILANQGKLRAKDVLSVATLVSYQIKAKAKEKLTPAPI